MTFIEFEAPGYRLTSSAEALNWVVAELRDLKAWRDKLDRSCADSEVRRGDLRREFWQFLVRHGKVIGALMALHRVGWLTNEQYMAIRKDANTTMVAVSTKLCE